MLPKELDEFGFKSKQLHIEGWVIGAFQRTTEKLEKALNQIEEKTKRPSSLQPIYHEKTYIKLTRAQHLKR